MMQCGILADIQFWGKVIIMWESYLQNIYYAPTDMDRIRLENYIQGKLPDSYWRLACKHQGRILRAFMEIPRHEKVVFGILLLANSVDSEKENYSYCIEYCLNNMQGYYPDGILPFSDDTGGNYFSFDFRGNSDAPSVVFIDHEFQGEGALIHVANNFELFMSSLIVK